MYQSFTLETLSLGGATTAISPTLGLNARAQWLAIQANFVRAAGGTTCTTFIQTSLDNGATWFDIMCFAFDTTTAVKISAISSSVALAAASSGVDGALADDTILNGVLGDRIRAKTVIVGTYTGASTLTLTGIVRGDAP